MRPVLCFITDGACARGGTAAEDQLVARVAAAIHAGVHLVQVRERDLEGRALLRLVRRCVAVTRGSRSRIVVNDRVDVAIAAAAHGVHLRGDSLPAPAVRAIAPAGFLVGRSVHGAEEAATVSTAGGLDYLIFGTVFPSGSKPGVEGAGTGMLGRVVTATPLPVLAVGGVTAANAAAVAAAGAAGLAAIGLFAAAPGEIPAAVAHVVHAFDTPGGVA